MSIDPTQPDATSRLRVLIDTLKSPHVTPHERMLAELAETMTQEALPEPVKLMTIAKIASRVSAFEQSYAGVGNVMGRVRIANDAIESLREGMQDSGFSSDAINRIHAIITRGGLDASAGRSR